MATIKYKSQPAIPVVLVNDPNLNDGVIDVNIASSDITIGGGSVATKQYLKVYDVQRVQHTINVIPTIDVELTGKDVYDVTIDFDPYLNTVIFAPEIFPGEEDVEYAIYDFGNGYIYRKNDPNASVDYDYSLSPDGLYNIVIYFHGASGNYVTYNFILLKNNGYISKLTRNTIDVDTYDILLNTVYLPIEGSTIETPIDENGDDYVALGVLSFNYTEQKPPIYSTTRQYTPTTECNTLSNGIQYSLLTALDECTLSAIEDNTHNQMHYFGRLVLSGVVNTPLPPALKFLSVYPVTVGNPANRPKLTDSNGSESDLYQGVEEKFEIDGIFDMASTAISLTHINDVVIIRYIYKVP